MSSPLRAWRAYIFLPLFFFFFFQLTRLILHVKRTFDVALLCGRRCAHVHAMRRGEGWCRGESPRAEQADACGRGRLF